MPPSKGRQRRRHLILVAAVALAALVPARVQGQTLEEALATAYEGNPTLQAGRAELRAVNEGVPQALSNWRPQVSVTGSAGKQKIESTSSFVETDDTTTPVEARAEIEQPLYRGGRTVAATERAEHLVQSERAQLVSVEQDVLLRGVTAYMDVWRDQAELDLNINNERVLQRQLEATQDRFTVGEVTRTDVAQAETRLAVATAARVGAEGALASSSAVFEEVIGFAPGELVAPSEAPGLPSGLADTVEQGRQRNPDVISSLFDERAALRQVREIEGEFLPTVSLNASVSHSEETSQRDSETDRAQILAQVSVPLYQQGLVSSRVREAKQISNQRRIQIVETRRRVEQESVSAWQALVAARAQIVSFEAGVRSAEIALEGVQQEHAVGARTVLDVLDAEQELLDARVSLVRSQRDEVVAAYRVLAAIGRLTAAELGLPVEVYDPDLDYYKVRNKWFGLEAPGTE
jgi:TolC family type I secretion outer membrane protein